MCALFLSKTLNEEADAELPYVPTAVERAADPAHLELIRSRYGSRAPTLINVLLAFDGYFNWYYPLFDSIPFRCNMDVRYGRALSNCRTAIDMFEITERVTIHCHKSFLFHGAIFKVSRDILKVGCIWKPGISSLELLNAETKRTATTGANRHLTISTSGQTMSKQMVVKQGPAQLVQTKGYSGTMASSTLNKMLGKTMLRQGDGEYALPASRRTERLFGETATGRTKRERAASVPLQLMGREYNPRIDTCLAAFVRLLEAL